jgi:hypothetical protein
MSDKILSITVERDGKAIIYRVGDLWLFGPRERPERISSLNGHSAARYDEEEDTEYWISFRGLRPYKAPLRQLAEVAE